MLKQSFLAKHAFQKDSSNTESHLIPFDKEKFHYGLEKVQSGQKNVSVLLVHSKTG